MIRKFYIFLLLILFKCSMLLENNNTDKKSIKIKAELNGKGFLHHLNSRQLVNLMHGIVKVSPKKQEK